ncbi:MAG TPA: hypothetical protein VLZ50_08995 [Terracidiphilus sp.]|nr:hypothetical protein [Terracidiphilus sp.]
MKSSISTFALAAVVAIASLSTAHAQTQASRVIVPFAFECGGASFAPGTYTISKLDGEHITLRDSKTTSMVMIDNADGPKNAKLGFVAFRKYGNRYFLAEYHPANSAHSMDLPESGKERRVATDYAMNRTEPGRVQLALNEGDWIR